MKAAFADVPEAIENLSEEPTGEFTNKELVKKEVSKEEEKLTGKDFCLKNSNF